MQWRRSPWSPSSSLSFSVYLTLLSINFYSCVNEFSQS
jgi:hypothetical protein